MLTRNRQGQALPIVALTLVALLGMAALAIDLAMLIARRAEAQRGADAIALAGASAFLGNSPGQYASDAKARAKEYAGRNYVQNVLIDTVTVSETALTWESAEAIVHVIPDSMKVRALVQKDEIGLWFAKVLGFNIGRVAAVAAAQVSQAGAARCMVPFAIPVDPNTQMTLGQQITLKSADSSIVEGADPFFAPFSMPDDPTVMDYCPRATGLEDDAWGRRDVCTSCTPQNGRFPGESFGGWHQSTSVDEWMAGEQSPSGNVYPGNGYAENICGDNCSQVEAGSIQTIVTGDMDGPTSWGVNARLARDPTVWWNENDSRVWRNNTPLEDYASTPRVVTVPTFNPGVDLTHSSDRDFEVTGFAYFLLEAGPQHGFYDPADQLEITGRFLWYAPGSESGNSPYSRVLRLVE